MDTILENYLDDFRKDFSFKKEESTKLFEHFVNYCLITKIDSDRNAIENVNVGGKSNPGIDGIAIIVNEHVVNTREQVDYFLESLGRLEVEFIFIQSKTSEHFEMSEIGTFLTCVFEFFNKDTTMRFEEELINLIDIKDYIFTKSIKIEKNPTLKLYFATCGKYFVDPNIDSIVSANKKNLDHYELFSKIQFIPIDRDIIKKLYREIKNAITREIQFEKHTIFPAINGISESFIGLLPGEEYLKLICDDNHEILRNIFYDNVRDFQGFNQVNSEIKNTIQNNKDKFSLMNNGVTIVARKLNKVGTKFIISNYQIVNGCQTSHVIFHLKEKIDRNIYIPIKLIITDNYEITSGIIRATNRQTEVKSEAFEILSPFHKKLEEFYNAMRSKYNIPIFYERRNRQFEGISIERKNVITLSNQISSFIAMFLDEPHSSSQRYYGELLKLYKSKMFDESHNLHPYFISGFCLQKLEQFFQESIINKKYCRFKYHIMMMFKYKCNKNKFPQLNSKEAVKICDRMLEIILEDTKFLQIVNLCIDDLQKKIGEWTGPVRNCHQTSLFTEFLLMGIQKTTYPSGKISYYNASRGYGFISTSELNDIFFHISEYRKTIKDEPSIGDSINFDIVDGDNGKKAINIVKQ